TVRLAFAAVMAAAVTVVARGSRLRRSGPAAIDENNAAVVPHALRGPKVDGELDDDVWAESLRSGPFKRDVGQLARTPSEARLLWGEGELFIGLYAADDDIQARVAERDGPLWLSDAFQLSLRTASETFQIDVAPNGALTDARRAGSESLDYGWSSLARV